MTKKEAKRLVCGAVSAIIDPCHPNEFLYEAPDGTEYRQADVERMQVALAELYLELRRRGGKDR